MAHELASFVDGRARMAYVGETPWHGLGQVLTPNSPIEVWAKEAGFDFTIATAQPIFKDQQGNYRALETKQVLHRSDTGEALGVVGDKYKVVQPIEVLEFFRDLVADKGFQLETAGVLFNGAKYWALARTGNEVRISGNDVLKEYLMLATACDGTLKTVARRTSVRVVCNNTLRLTSKDADQDVKVSHASTFSASAVHVELGLAEAPWTEFTEQVQMLAETPVTDQQAIDFVLKLFGDASKPLDAQSKAVNVGKVLQLYAGQGKGSELASSKGTAWGLLNATTEVLDWHIGKSQDRRLESAWFQKGAHLKDQAFANALLIAA